MDHNELITRIDTSEEGSSRIKVMLNLKTTYSDTGETQRTIQVQPNNDLQFITITDPSQSQIPRNKRIVRSQAMRHARNRVRSTPHKNQSPFPSGACNPAALKARCSHVQPHGSTPCFCRVPDDVCGDQRCHEAPSTEIVAVRTGYHSPVSVLGSGRVDPFGCFPIEMSPYMNFLVDYYTQIAGQVQVLNSGSSSPLSAILIPLARSNEAVLHGLLCVAGSRVTVESGGHTPRQWEIYHRGEAIRLITAGLSNPIQAISDEMVTTIILICGYDILFGHYEDLETHLKGVERIVAVRGGVDKLGHGGVLRIMVSWANHFRKRPKNGRSPKTLGLAPPQPSNVNIQPHVSWFMDSTGPLVPFGIRKATLSGQISPELFKSINTLCSLVFEVSDLTPRTPASALKFTDRREDLEQNLKNFLHGPSRIVSEQSCVLAVLIYEHITLKALTEAAASVIELSRDLKIALEQTDLSLYWGGDVNLLLWVLFIGYVSGHLQAQKSWFANLIGEVALNTNQRLDIEGLKKILKDFLYSEAHFGILYMDLWTWLAKNH